LDQDQAHADLMLVSTGDRIAFARLFRYYAPRCVAFLQEQGLTREQAEAITRQVMVTVWRRAAAYEPACGTVSTWIFAWLRYHRIDHNRSDGRSITPSARSGRDTSPSPDTLHRQPFVREEETATPVFAAAALGRLQRAQRQVIEMAFLQQHTHSEIAAFMGLPIATVQAHIREALQTLGGSAPEPT